MADSTRRVSVRLSLDDAASVKSGLREVGETGQREMQRITRSAEMASRSLSLLGPVLAGLSIGGVAAMVRSAVDAVGGLGELADAAGVSTDALQAFGYAATQVGLSNEELQRSLQALTRRIADAAIGEQAAQQAFTRLGISFRDTAGNARATEAVMAELAERIAGLSDPAERSAAATAIFGDRLGQRMIPFLLQGRDGLERLTAEALRFGAIADADLIAKADEASDKIAALERAFSSLARNLLAQVAPALSTVASAINRVMTGASLAERRASLEQNRDALQRRLAELEAEAAGQAALSSQPRRGTIHRGAVGVAREQAGVTRTGLIAEIRQQLDEVQREIAALEAEARTAEERARQILNPDSRAGGGNEAAMRRQRAAEDIARLQENLDARLRIEREFQTRLTRIREAEAAGAIDAAEGQRLAAAATGERDEALQRLTASQRGATASTRENRDAERKLNEVLRERERLIQQNETAYERYQRRIETLGRLVERSERVGRPVPDETIRREATAALEELERAERRVAEGAERARDVGRELGLTFSSAFEDAIIRGRRFSEVLQGIGQDIARIIARRTITEPLGNALSSALSGFSFDGIGSWLGGLFRADGGPVTAGQPYVVGERGPEWFVPRQSGTVLPNGTGPGGTTINTSIAIDARGADAGVEARLRLLGGQIARQASAMTLDAIRRGGAAYDTVRG
ncbi:MAG: phage tail tape measure protein [Acetobacteraceae bacterium]